MWKRYNSRTVFFLGFVISVISFGIVACSKGDDQEKYQNCIARCNIVNKCQEQAFWTEQSLLYRLFYWTCDAECQYQCMWAVEKENRAQSIQVTQYYGKWPFVRVVGFQELFSALFSMGNLLAHWYGYNYIYQRFIEERTSEWFLHGIIKANCWISINAWFWSTVFHSRDTQFTMYMDYFSAIALLFTSVLLAIVRVFNVRAKRQQLLVALPLLVYYVKHILYMAFEKFDFNWNMKVGITAALTFIILLFVWGSVNLLMQKRKHVKYVMYACIGSVLAALLEVNDFPPIFGLLDAHALWHAATIPIIILWYKFYREDITYDLGITLPRKIYNPDAYE